MRRRLRLLAVVPLLALAACTGDSDPGQAAPEAGQSSPQGYASHTVGPLTFAAPQDWEPVEQPTTPAEGTATLSVQAPGPDGQPAPVALALVARQPQRDAAAEVEALVTIMRDVRKAEDVRQRPVELDGFDSATVVSFRQTQVTGGPQQTDVLVGDLPDGSLATLTVTASPTVHAEQGLDAIVLTATAAAARS